MHERADQIREWIAIGLADAEIARRVGCSRQRVHQVRHAGRRPAVQMSAERISASLTPEQREAVLRLAEYGRNGVAFGRTKPFWSLARGHGHVMYESNGYGINISAMGEAVADYLASKERDTGGSDALPPPSPNQDGKASK